MLVRIRTPLIILIIMAHALLGITGPAGSAAAPVAQETTCPPTCSLNLPIIATPPVLPFLNEPTSQANIDSLAPVLLWTTAITGTKHYVQVANDPSFIAGTFEFSTTRTLEEPGRELQRSVIRNNLDPSTTYYWRVGVVLPQGINFTDPIAFTTAPMDPARLPTELTLLTPQNNATAPSLMPTFSWVPLPGGDYYRLKLINPDGTTLRTTSPLEEPSYTPDEVIFVSGAVYTWQVKAHNSYGWSEYGTIWSFIAP
jgi:hypothetical protein